MKSVREESYFQLICGSMAMKNVMMVVIMPMVVPVMVVMMITAHFFYPSHMSLNFCQPIDNFR